MDVVRFGRIVRALRRRRGWRQVDLALRAGVSQQLISMLERGHAAGVTVGLLERVAAVLDARLIVRIDWHGEAADRLLDAGHAAIVEAVVAMLHAAGWMVVPEATFAIRGERGSIDVLAWHAGSSTLLVVEVKSVVADVQGALAPFDRKLRLAREIAAERGWRPTRIASLFVIKDDRTARRRVDDHATTFDTRFPDRVAKVRRFVADPARHPTLHGLMFLTATTPDGGRHRVQRRGPRA